MPKTSVKEINQRSSYRRRELRYSTKVKCKNWTFFMIIINKWSLTKLRGSHPEVFLGKGVLKMCNKFTEEHPWQSVISKELPSNFIEITLWHGCAPVILLQAHLFLEPPLSECFCNSDLSTLTTKKAVYHHNCFSKYSDSILKPFNESSKKCKSWFLRGSPVPP